MSTADTIRRAAERLEWAARGGTRLGRWAAHRDQVYETWSAHGDVVAEAGLSTGDATYIAVVDPAVGDEVAVWLHLVARVLDEGFSENAEARQALRVAQAILREEGR